MINGFDNGSLGHSRLNNSSNHPAYDWIPDKLASLRKAHWYRQVQMLDGASGPVVHVNGRPCLNFASNDYLGLASDARLVEAARRGAERYGTGSSGSRLLSGHRPIHADLEQALARLKHTADALVFSSGYLANLGAIATLVSSRDLILTDQYNHASLKAGARLSGATVMAYPHGDVVMLSQFLAMHRAQYRRCLIVTDGVFSMDGDLCPLPQILDLADQHCAMTLVDDAHGTGVLGQTGAGCAEQLGCTGRAMIQVGTLSKALGSLGGFIAGSAPLIDLLRNRASSWIYTTGLSPAAAASARCALDILQREPARLARLAQNRQYLSQRLTAALAELPQPQSADAGPPLQLLPSDSPIFCLQVRDAATVRSLGQQLIDRGILAAAVRPPTVPTSRLRLTVMATHEQTHLDQLVEQLVCCVETGGG
ncbi:MAG: 8-amino-7-oxononanoate synthase [Cyanobacteria bacterium P01_A01_bin.105]